MNGTIKNLSKISRPNQWIKSGLVYLAPLMSGELVTMNLKLHFKLITATIIFITSSIAVYCVNDLVDLKIDMKNPKKANRPLAKDAIKKSTVAFFALFMFFLSVAIA